jgi:two-component system response regulator FixJ
LDTLASDVAGERILVVEDDARVARTICAMLRRASFSAHTVECAGAIGPAMAAESFDVVISDINLPDDRHLGFLDELESRGDVKVPVVLVTGRPSVETAVRALRYGVVDYLQKPFERKALIDSVNKALRWRQAIQVVEQAQRDAEAWLRSLQTTSRLLQFTGPSGGPPSVAGLDDADGTSEPASPLIAKLSGRERDIVRELCMGRRVAEMAEGLRISPNTVRNHLKSIFRKLGVSSQVELLARLGGQTDDLAS